MADDDQCPKFDDLNEKHYAHSVTYKLKDDDQCPKFDDLNEKHYAHSVTYKLKDDSDATTEELRSAAITREIFKNGVRKVDDKYEVRIRQEKGFEVEGGIRDEGVTVTEDVNMIIITGDTEEPLVQGTFDEVNQILGCIGAAN